MSNLPFTSKRAAVYADVPDEKWNNWRWQLSNRINTAEEFEKSFLSPIVSALRSPLHICFGLISRRISSH